MSGAGEPMLLILGNRDTTSEGALFFGGEMLSDSCARAVPQLIDHFVSSSF